MRHKRFVTTIKALLVFRFQSPCLRTVHEDGFDCGTKKSNLKVVIYAAFPDFVHFVTSLPGLGFASFKIVLRFHDIGTKIFNVVYVF